MIAYVFNSFFDRPHILSPDFLTHSEVELILALSPLQALRSDASSEANGLRAQMKRKSIGTPSSSSKRKRDQGETTHATSFVRKLTTTGTVGSRCSSGTLRDRTARNPSNMALGPLQSMRLHIKMALWLRANPDPAPVRVTARHPGDLIVDFPKTKSPYRRVQQCRYHSYHQTKATQNYSSHQRHSVMTTHDPRAL